MEFGLLAKLAWRAKAWEDVTPITAANEVAQIKLAQSEVLNEGRRRLFGIDDHAGMFML